MSAKNIFSNGRKSSRSKELDERVHLGTRSERVPQNEERGRNETTFFGKERSRNESTYFGKERRKKDSFLFRSFLLNFYDFWL